jgi:hypothetical protein
MIAMITGLPIRVRIVRILPFIVRLDRNLVEPVRGIVGRAAAPDLV